MKECYIRFMALVNSNSAERLISIIDNKVKNRYTKINLLISSPGGSVFHGLSIYNFLRGLPIEIVTHNFGSVDSIGVILFCAGKERYCVPHARFLIHGVTYQTQGNIPMSLDEKHLEEKLKGLQIDQSNIARVIADTTNKTQKEIENDMHDRTTLDPGTAKEYGLVTKIKSELLPVDAEFYSVGEFDKGQTVQTQQVVVPNQFVPKNQDYTYTSYFDIGEGYTDSLS